MTIEELKDLIDSTINENGTKAITGKALNLALNEITNAVAEAATTGGGGGVKRLYADVSGGTLTNEQLASNAALYTEIVTAMSNGEMPPQVNGVAYIADIGGNAGFWSDLIYTANGLVVIFAHIIVCELASDGSVTVQVGG